MNDKRLHPPGPLKESRLKEYRDKMRDRAVTPTVQPVVSSLIITPTRLDMFLDLI